MFQTVVCEVSDAKLCLSSRAAVTKGVKLRSVAVLWLPHADFVAAIPLNNTLTGVSCVALLALLLSDGTPISGNQHYCCTACLTGHTTKLAKRVPTMCVCQCERGA